MKKFLIALLLNSFLYATLFAADSAGISGTVTTLSEAGNNQTVIFQKGWNLVGINTNATLKDLQNKLGSNNILIIQGPHTVYKKEYVDNNKAFLNNFEKFKDGEGYWIKVANDKTINFTTTSKPVSIKLKSGWNLTNPTKLLTLQEIKTQIGEDNLLIIQGPHTVYKKEYVENNKAFLNNFTNFVEPEGYWIKVKNDATLTFN